MKYVFSGTNYPGNERTNYIHTNSDTTLNEHVQKIKKQNGKDIWLYGGAKLITTFVNLDLVDVYRLAVHPVILGGGKPLFENIAERKDLKLTGLASSKGGVVMLNYEAKK